MISKNKKLFLKIYILFVIIISIALIILQILGSKNRVGYLTDFNLNIERMLNLYDLENIIEDFTVDGELDEESIKNYLLTNENITNYVHHFRIRYYDKTFRNNDIYGVYPDLSNLPDYMENAKMEENGSPYGNFISDKKEISEEKIDDINYILKIKPKIPILLYFILSLILIIYFYNDIHKFTINTNIYRKYDNFFTEKRFIILIISIGFILFIFQFWLGFPGYFDYPDAYSILWEAITNQYDNWHPIIIGLTLHILFNIFGYHSFYIFFINLVLWYGGLTLIIISLYLKFKNRLSIFLLLISFIGNIFFMNINHLKDTTSSLFVWFAYSIIFFQIFTNNKNLIFKIVLDIICFLSLILGLLWRHNMIVTIYPIFILFTYLLLKNKNIKNIKNYIKSFVILMLMWAIILICIVKIFPHILGIHYNYASNHLFLLQIAGCSVPANDNSLIPNEWYENGKTFEDVKKVYNDNPLIADNFSSHWYKDRPFLAKTKLNNLHKVWIKYILKYPVNYIKHIGRFFIAYCLINKNNHWLEMDSNSIQKISYYEYKDMISDYDILNSFDTNEQKITFTALREKIYSFLFSIIINIPIIYFAIISFIIFIICFILIFIKRIFDNDILIYSFCVSFSAIATLWIVVLFTPGISYRYIHPVCPISIISLISFLTFIYDRGGFKKFFKELKEGENK